MNPETLRGAAIWMLFGLGSTILALLVASLFPGIIPARAQQVNL